MYKKTLLELFIFDIGTELLTDEEIIAIERVSLERSRQWEEKELIGRR